MWEAVYIIEGLLKNTSEVQPTTVHADTQGQSFPVFALAHLLGFDLMPRIRNWKNCTFYRPSRQSEYVHIDALFGEPGKHVIDWDLIESQFRHLMRVAVSVREGAISSSTLLKRLRSGSRKNATYTAFREVGRVIRTAALLRYLSDAPLRRRVTTATNKVESFNRFCQWIGFGNRGVIADNDPVEQEKAMKFNALLTNDLLTELLAEFSQVSDLVAETSLSRPWKYRETWRLCPSRWSGNWWLWRIRGSPTGSSTRPGSRSRELVPSCVICREPVVRRRPPVPTGWICCAGCVSCGLSRCRGTERDGSRRGTSPAGCKSPGSRGVLTGGARTRRDGGPQVASRTRRRCERTARRCCGASTTSTATSAPDLSSTHSRWTDHVAAGGSTPTATRWT
ncbi:hypothetical protein GCM10027162_70850 [Streptomyces incanus]